LDLASFKAILYNELRGSIKEKKVFLIIILVLALAFLVQLSSDLQIILFLFFKPKSVENFTIVIAYYSLVILLPVFAILLSYDLISEETEKKTIRLIATKVSRQGIFVAKLLYPIIITSIITIIILVLTSIYAYFKLEQSIFTQILIAIIFLSSYALTFISLSFFSSTITNKENSSLLLSIILLIAFLVINNIDNISYLSPFYYTARGLTKLWFDPTLFMICFSLVFILLSFKIFRRKDL